MNRLRLTTFIVISATLAATPDVTYAAEIKGRAVSTIDGDTFTLLTPAHRQIKIRLAQIDAPEKGQPWGDKSKKALTAYIVNRDLRVEITGQDRYGRTIGEVHAGLVYVNAELVKSGAAWAYTQYLTDRRFVAYERQARQERQGLWSMPSSQTVAPWNWRANRRNQASAGSRAIPQTMKSPNSNTECGTRHYCRQMASCQEARYYLKQCHVLSLDADGDGVPCESLCRPR